MLCSAGFKMMAKLRMIEVKAGKNVELPEKIIPVKLEPIMEPSGLTATVPSGKFLLYYFERDSSR
jgi:hypothetical protein